MSVNLGSIISTSKSKRYPSGNPYLKFLRNPEKHATKWRKPVPMRAKDILNASTVEKSKFITDKIIGDFIKWKETICDSKDVEIDETVMSQLFEIGESVRAPGGYIHPWGSHTRSIRIVQLSLTTSGAALRLCEPNKVTKSLSLKPVWPQERMLLTTRMT